MPDNKPIVATTGSMQLFSGNSASVSSATNSGIPILGLDTINEQETRVNNELPQGTPNDIEYKPYGWEELGRLTQDSYAISPVGMFYRQAKKGTGDFWERYKPSITELDQIYKQVGTDEDVLDVVLRGADTYEEVEKNIALYKQNLEIERRIANSPWYWQLYSGIIGAFGNPVDLGTMALTAVVPPAGAVLGASAKAAKAIDIGGRIAANVVSGVAANQVAGEVSGLETNAWRDVAAITTLSGAMEVVGYAAAKLKASKIKGVLAHDKYVTNGEKPKAIGDFAPEIEKVTKSKGFVTKLNDMREQLTSGLPSLTVKSELLELRKEGSKLLNGIIDNLTHYEQGVRSDRTSSGQSKIYLNRDRASLPEGEVPETGIGRIGTTLLGSGKATFFEETKKLRVDGERYTRGIPNDAAILMSKYGDNGVNEYIMLKGEGYDIPPEYAKIDADPIAKRLMKNYMDFYVMRGKQNVAAGVHSDIWGYTNYVPMRISKDSWINASKRYGGDKRMLKKLTMNLYNGVVNSPKHYEWFKEIYQRKLAEKIAKEKEEALAKGLEYKAPKELTPEELDVNVNDYILDMAEKAAIGYADQNVMTKPVADNYSDFSIGFSYTKERHPWNAAYKDSDGFSLNSLRADPIDTLQRYERRSAGLIASKRVYGKDYEEFTNMLNDAANEVYIKHHRDPKVKDHVVENIMAMYKRGFGMSINDRGAYDATDAVSTILKNGMFSTVGTLMGPLNSGEIGALVNAYGAGSLIRSIPGVHNFVKDFAKKGRLSDSDVQMLNQYLVGRELNEVMNLKAALRQAEKALDDVNPYLSKVVGFSNWFAQHSPAGFLMRVFQNTINDEITNSVTSEMIARAYNPTSKGIKGMFKDPKVYERLGLTNKDVSYMQRVLKKIAVVNKDKTFSINEKALREAMDDDKFRDTFIRIHTYAFEESLQRRTPDDIFTWEVGRRHPIFELAMQFKTFAIQSYNKRFVKLMNRIEDGDSLAMVNFTLTTTALSGLVNMMLSYTRSLGMEEEKRDEYLDRTIGFHDFKGLDDPEVLGRALFYNLVNRNPLFAAFALLWNSAGVGTGGKTTSSTNEDFKGDVVINDIDPARTAADMIPAYRIGASALSFGLGSYNAGAIAMDEESDTYENRSKTARQLLKGLNLLPYVPYLSPVLRDHVKDSLEEYKYGY